MKIVMGCLAVMMLWVPSAYAEKVLVIVQDAGQSIELANDQVHVQVTGVDQHNRILGTEVVFQWGSSTIQMVNDIKDAIISAYAGIGVTTTRNEIVLFGGPN